MSTTSCPNCKKIITTHHCIDNDGQEPSPGVISVCEHCTIILKFTEEMQLQGMMSDEIDQLEPETIFALFKKVTVIKNNHRLKGRV